MSEAGIGEALRKGDIALILNQFAEYMIIEGKYGPLATVPCAIKQLEGTVTRREINNDATMEEG